MCVSKEDRRVRVEGGAGQECWNFAHIDCIALVCWRNMLIAELHILAHFGHFAILQLSFENMVNKL